MSLSFWQIALVAVLFLLLFGRGKIPQLMGDLAEGIKSFRKGVSDVSSDTEESNQLKKADSVEGKS
ncbi:twin-arginine translocase TatA/TatE family subunit [Cellvibrio sp. ARAG 10.3]|uniref:twin-arginine translocase TatA/TatE family subunit n=1 Tax=Cellvibrio sp. ARAG 10.3 TaxID=3451358 RepID=UPI003F44C532